MLYDGTRHDELGMEKKKKKKKGRERAGTLVLMTFMTICFMSYDTLDTLAVI